VTPLLVVSCDRYADVWPAFFHVLFRQWPDCPYPVFLGTNFRTFDHERVQTLPIGQDRSWSSNVRAMLSALGSERIIFFLEDFLIHEAVQTEKVTRLVDIARRENIDCVRLSPLPRALETAVSGSTPYPYLGIVPSGSPYRVSTQPAVWRTDALQRYLEPGLSPWGFEELGTLLSNHRRDVFWAPFQPSIVYDHAIEKGRWKRSALELSRMLGAAVDESARSVWPDDELASTATSKAENARIPVAKRRMIDAFLAGDRRSALSIAAVLLKERRWSPQFYLIVAAGMLGRSSITLLDRLNLRRKLLVLRKNTRRSIGAAR
jgi:hypothetical protein